MSTNDSPEYLAASRVPALLAGYIIPIPLEILTTSLRLWVKIAKTTQHGLAFDDYLMIWATIVGVGLCISGLVYGPPYGMGRHRDAVSEHDAQMFRLGDYVFSHFYDMAIASTKLSVLALYYRIFVTLPFRYVVILTAVFVVLWLMAIEIVLGFECRPIRAFWDLNVPGKCFDLVAFGYFTNITNLIIDMWIFVLPIPVILKLQITKNKKIGLCFLFSVGLGTCGISAARLSVVVSQGSSDFTWSGVPLGILSAWEPLGGILCANLPIIYKSLASAFLAIQGTIQTRTDPSHSANVSNNRLGKGSMPNDWVRLNNSSGIVGDYHSMASEISTANATEMQPINTIVVERQFKQEIYREGVETLIQGKHAGHT